MTGQCSWVLLCAVVMAMITVIAADTAPAVPQNEDVHVVFLTDCTSYSDWQTLGMVFSWRESGQVCCVGSDSSGHNAALEQAVMEGVMRCYQSSRGHAVLFTTQQRAASVAACH